MNYVLNIIKLYEFYLDRWEGDYEILEDGDQYSIGLYPHFREQFNKRVASLPSVLQLPSSVEELTKLIMTECRSSISGGLSKYKGGSLKGYYTQVHPITVQSKGKKDLFEIYVELTVMYNLSGAFFSKNSDAYEGWRNLRSSGASSKELSKYMLDNCVSGWKPYVKDGIIAPDKLAVFLETVVVTISDKGTYPVTWTNMRNDLGRYRDDFSTITANKNLLKTTVETINQVGGCVMRVSPDSGFYKYCKDNKIRL